ncbi:MAG TPA: Fe-S cluster assembly protein SufB, partial [Porphyromonadaceae bacterium]|nr:Fe-S cluster assembly protein SufB [Porphyromonadaceae bacterium]
MEEETIDILKDVTEGEYKEGFQSDIETEYLPKGLNEDIIRAISQKREEPDWLLRFRLDAYHHWLTLTMPRWAHLNIPDIDFQEIIYYAAPKKKNGP